MLPQQPTFKISSLTLLAPPFPSRAPWHPPCLLPASRADCESVWSLKAPSLPGSSELRPAPSELPRGWGRFASKLSNRKQRTISLCRQEA